MGLVIGGGRGMTKLKNLVTALVGSIKTSWSSTPLDTNIPSEKLVHDTTVLRTATLTMTLATAYTTLGRQVAINGLAGSYIGVIFLNGTTYDIRFFGTQINGVRSATGLAGTVTLADAFTASVTNSPKMITGTAFAALIGVSSIHNAGYYEIADSSSATYTIGSQYWLSTVGVATSIFSPSTKADITPSTGATSALRALFVAAGATYNNDGTYTLGSLTDITHSQMTEIFLKTFHSINIVGTVYSAQFSTIRCAFPGVYNSGGVAIGFDGRFSGCTQMEVLEYNTGQGAGYGHRVQSGYSAFYNCYKLHTIDFLTIDLCTSAFSVSGMFTNCLELATCKLKWMNVNFSWAFSPKITLASLQYLIDNRKNGTIRRTVTVHPTVWAKLNDSVNYPTWNALLVDAYTNQYIDFGV